MNRIKVAQIGTSKYSHGTNIMNSIRKLTDIFDFVGYVPAEDEKEKFQETLKTMEPFRAFKGVWDISQEKNVTLRTGAYLIAVKRVMEAKKLRGIWP